MKLKTKLLPLVGIAATATIVTPLVTSCKLSKLDMVDLSKPYIPTTKSSVAGELTQQEATQTYINDVKTNSEIFRQDFLYGVQNKLTKAKNNFLNLPSTTSGRITATNFKLNSLTAGVSTPTFGSTSIAYPGEPKVTYPTVSFEYSIQIEYKYEYLGYMESTLKQMGGRGYDAKTVKLETNVKYTNVPFLAVAHEDLTGTSTYWQVTPIDTILVNAIEEGDYYTHYYDQAYMFQYMEDDWSIDVNSTSTINEYFVSSESAGSSYEYTSTPTYNLTIDTWDELEEILGLNNGSKKLTSSYEYVSSYNLMVEFANFGFESYYLSSVAQKPELQATGKAQGYGVISATESERLASFGTFYLPQTSFAGKIKIFSGFAEDGKTPYGAIVLNNKETATPITLTIGDTEKPEEGVELTQDTVETQQWGVDDQPLTWAATTTVAEGTYNFVLPKTIVAQFIPDDGESWTQVVYLNQDTLPIGLSNAA